MRKDSPVEQFSGYVILPEFLTLPQVRAVEDALGDLREMQPDDQARVWLSVISEKRLPAILACVQEWHIDRLPEDPSLETFPMTPIVSANEFVNWLFGEIRKIWLGEIEDPKD